MNTQELPSGPPFDGKPCAMCPTEYRGLAASAHNLSWRIRELDRYGGSVSLCVLSDKFESMVYALRLVKLSVGVNDRTPEPIRRLFNVCEQMANECRVVIDLAKFKDELSAAVAGVEALSSAHFADRFHSRGEL